ncbi:MAG TPA: tetratricopeptide repeat protein [Acidobacteriota bacterium]|nr:tetratricopeptide repeat protein [Acidobacteriota bacterium]
MQWHSRQVWPRSRGFVPMLTLVLAMLLVAFVWVQRNTRLRGVVIDATGAPLEGVAVTAVNDNFAPGRFTAVTDDEGRWAMIGFGDRTAPWAFSFELEGYVTTQLSQCVKPLARRCRAGTAAVTSCDDAFGATSGACNADIDVTLQQMTDSGATDAGGGVADQSVNPDNYWNGVAAFEAEDYTGAVQSWQVFVTDNPDDFAVWLRLAEAYVRVDSISPAQAAYDRVLALSPEHPTALFMLASMSSNAGDLDAALDYFERVIVQDPENASLYYNIGEIYFQQSRASEAISFYSRAIEVDPGFSAAYKQLGFAHVNSGQMDEAIVAFGRYLELVPADGEEAAIVNDILGALRESQ